jgi:sulfur carrier protein ThiS
LPPVLRTVMDGQGTIEGEGTTIEVVLRSLSITYPALGLHLFDESGRPRRNIVCLHEGILVRAAEFAGHTVSTGDELVLTNALAGG